MAEALLDEDQLVGLAEAAGVEAVQMILDAFWESTDTLSAELNAALQTADVENIVKLGHAIKGSAANLGAAGLAVRAQEIETAARDGEIDRAIEEMKALSADVEPTRVAMDNLVARFA